MKRILITAIAMGLLLAGPLQLKAQHFVPVYESLYQPMNIVVDEATIDGVDLEAGDEIGIFDTTATGAEICVGSILLTGPILPGVPLPVVASLDDPLTTDQDGFIDGHPILYRFWDSSESLELYCVTMDYDPAFDQVFQSLGTALGSMNGIYSATAAAGPDDETCEDTPYTLMGAATNQQSVQWTTSGDGSFDNAALLNATYTPGSSDITAGSVILTLTAFAVSPCGEHGVDDMVLSVQALPTADAGVDTTTCEDASYMLDGMATDQDSVLWSTSGDGSFDDPMLLNATYTPGSGDITSGSATLTLTAYAILPCGTDASDDMVLSIQLLPTANAGDDAAICEGDTYTLAGSATDYDVVQWTTSGDGTFDDPTLLNATYTPGSSDISAGSATLTLTAEAMEPCDTDAEDDMVLSIQQMPTANAGPDDLICEGENYTLAGTASNQSTVLWTTSGDGSFDDPALLNATYTPGSGDIGNGMVTLSLTANAMVPCGAPFIDEMDLSIDPLPEQPPLPDGPTMVDIHITPTSEYTTQSTAGASAYLWSLSPDDAGSISGNGLTGTATWNAAYHGLAYVKVYAVNDCGAVASDSLEVDVYNTVGTFEGNIQDVDVQIIPNPNHGQFSLMIPGNHMDLNISVFSSKGELLYSAMIGSNETQADFDLGHLTEGLYFVRIYNKNTSQVEKLIIR